MSHDRLRPLWDFSDLDATETRLHEALAAETTDAGRAEVLTQLARVEGLRGRFDQAERIVAEAEQLAADSEVARTRVLLERGRILRSSGDPDGALPLFEQAYELALEAGADFIAADAAHMAAIVGDFEAWTRRGLQLADEREGAASWRGTLLNNLASHHAERGEHEQSLAAYKGSLRAREPYPEQAFMREWARCGVAASLRALGRAEEAVPLLEQAVAWAQEAGVHEPWFHEELAAAYEHVSRAAEAAEQRRLAEATPV